MALFMVLSWGKERKTGREKVLLLIPTSQLCSSLGEQPKAKGQKFHTTAPVCALPPVTGKAGYY